MARKDPGAVPADGPNRAGPLGRKGSRDPARSPAAGGRIALTGTPGVGKTTLAGIAASHGFEVVDLKEWAKRAGAVVGHDAQDQADVIDVELLSSCLPPAEGMQIIEGHLSHLLGLDSIWVLRCDPRLLGPRLQARGYTPAKVLENLEAEALDIILMEALDQGVPVVQRDASQRPPSELWESLLAGQEWVSQGMHDLEPVDWSDQLPFHAPGKPKEGGRLGGGN